MRLPKISLGISGHWILPSTAMLLFLWLPFKADLQAMAVLDRVAGKPLPPALRGVASHAVRRDDLTVPSSAGPLRARMYVPVDRPNAPALVVLHGVHHLGIDEPRLVAFASSMASCGLRVLTPELPGIKDYRVGPESIVAIGDAAQWMAAHNHGRAVGVMGLSFAGGLALLAAGYPQFHREIAFVVTVGSQDDMARVASYFITGRDARPGGGMEVLPPHEYGALVLEYEHLPDFVPAADVAPLRAVLQAHLYEDKAREKQARAALTPQQQSETAQLLDTASPRTRILIAASNAKHLAEMAAVSPQGHIGDLRTPVYLLAGEADDVIPSAETQWLASQLPRHSVKAALISPVLSHLNLDGHGPSTWDRLKLVRFFAAVLRRAEAG